MFLFSRWERAVCRVKAIASSVERYCCMQIVVGPVKQAAQSRCVLWRASQNTCWRWVSEQRASSHSSMWFYFSLVWAQWWPYQRVSPLYGIHRYTQFYSIFYSIFFQINNVHNNYSFYVWQSVNPTIVFTVVVNLYVFWWHMEPKAFGEQWHQTFYNMDNDLNSSLEISICFILEKRTVVILLNSSSTKKKKKKKKKIKWIWNKSD